jgi:transcriptional regulator with XRE-family HTH domain
LLVIALAMAGTDPDLIRFGAAIRTLRMRRRLTQEKLAALSHLDRSFVGQIERGESNVSFLNVMRLLAGLKANWSELAALLD